MLLELHVNIGIVKSETVAQIHPLYPTKEVYPIFSQRNSGFCRDCGEGQYYRVMIFGCLENFQIFGRFSNFRRFSDFRKIFQIFGRFSDSENFRLYKAKTVTFREYPKRMNSGDF